MLIWQWGLIASSVVLLTILIFVFLRYLSLKKQASDAGVSVDKKTTERDGGLNDASLEERAQWLALLRQQRSICTRLLEESPKSDFQGRAALSCWSIFLDVEIQAIEQSLSNAEVLDRLDAFKGILDKIDHAQEIDELLKALKINQSILRDLNKIIQKASDKVSAQVNITSELNLQLDKLHAELAKEADLDSALALLRAEMASMCEFAERLKAHLAEVKEDGDNAQYVDALEAFLSDADDSDFLNSVRSELDDKVADLKQLAAYQKTIIEDLKEHVRQVKVGHEGDGKHIGEYDIHIVRLEKTLLESSRVVKRLEGKLESLQAIKYNLNIDVIKRDEELKKKKAILDQQGDAVPQGMDIYGVFDEERSAMKNMEDLLHQGSFTEESDAFASEQASKLSSLRQMVNESELYVEMLEKDLDKAHLLRESLEFKLLHPDAPMAEEADDSVDLDALASKDLEEIENLQEINDELDEERKRLEAELSDGQDQSKEFAKLQEKIEELDGKIETVQKNYVDMEGRYLTALMAKEDEQ
jgi:chromosome segregation ATPase